MKLAKVKIKTWVGTTAVGAQHYYADIEYWDREVVRVRTPASEARAARINRDRRELDPIHYWDDVLKPGEPADQYYTEGQAFDAVWEFISKPENRRGCDLFTTGDALNPGRVVWCEDRELVLKLVEINGRFEAAQRDSDEKEEDACWKEWQALINEERRPEPKPLSTERELRDALIRGMPVETVKQERPKKQCRVRQKARKKSAAPTDLPVTQEPLSVPVHIQNACDKYMASSFSETFYMSAGDMMEKQDDGSERLLGTLQYGADMRIAASFNHADGTRSRVYIDGEELWKALTERFAEIERDREFFQGLSIQDEQQEGEDDDE